MSASRSLSRLSSRLQQSFKFNTVKSTSPPISSSFKSTPSSNPISFISRSPVELRCMVSLMPLHSAIASARLNSMLSSESQSWGLIPQGNAMPL